MVDRVPPGDRCGTPEVLDMSSSQSEIAARLSGVSVRTRSDLEFSRHVVGGEPSYVAHDPIAFTSDSFGLSEYESFVAIDASETLGEAFQQLLNSGCLEQDQEDEFYEFIIGLHKLGLLSLPISDDKTLYERYEKQKRASRNAKILGFMFLRVPLWNPDAYLKRTLPIMRAAFTAPFFVVYAFVLLLSLFAAAQSFDEIQAPLLGLLDIKNVWLLWTVLIVNKLFHEFGHAYACRALGGRVPEMGAFFILFTPCAYVDASSSWGFSSRWRRMVVNLGGVYFESILAIAGLWVWLLTEPGFINTMAYQVMLMASAITILFNLNPLAKFDGYYVLSDLTNIPNLRQRASEQVTAFFCAFALGSRRPVTDFRWYTRCFLVMFAIASAIYRVVLVLTLSIVIASKFFMFGVLMAIAFIGMTVYGMLSKMVRFFTQSEEAARSPIRAAFVGLLLLLGVPSLFAFAPIPRPIQAAGVIEREQTRTIRAELDGRILTVDKLVGSAVHAGDLLLTLHNQYVIDEFERAAAHTRAARTAHALAIGNQREHEARQREVDRARTVEATALKRQDSLAVHTPIDGSIQWISEAVQTQAAIRAGDPLVRVGGGGWVAVVYQSEEASVDAAVEIGQRVQLRVATDPRTVIDGTVVWIATEGSRSLYHTAVTQAGGGRIAIDAASGEASEIYREIRIKLDVDSDADLLAGGRVYARFDVAVESLSDIVSRKFLRVVEKLRTQ